MDDRLTCDKEIQIEPPPSRVIRVMNAIQHNRKIQVNLPVSTTVWESDPRTVTLQEGLTQATEKLREQTVPRERYEELQQQLRNVNLSESQAFEGWRREEEKVAKVTRRLDIVIKQMDTLCSLYNDVLACRAPAKHYALWNDIFN